MNWYKWSQLLNPQLEIQPPGAYYEIGHRSFFGEEPDCQEWLWVWDEDTLDIMPTGDMDVSHTNIWGAAETFLYKGRVSECDNLISIAFPKGEKRKSPPEKLVGELTRRFPGMKMYLFHR
jgi:hypothetical protein